MRVLFKVVLIILLIATLLVFIFTPFVRNISHTYGEKVDSLNGVYVYYNGLTTNVEGRNVTKDNYNLGLKYQCVEFVKRYYYQYYNHKMPDSYGNAIDFYNRGLTDGELNKARNLIQYCNPGKTMPKEGDLLIFSPTWFNKYGHVAIVSMVKEDEIEIIQQNPGLFGGSKEYFNLVFENGEWEIESDRILGWLRMK